MTARACSSTALTAACLFFTNYNAPYYPEHLTRLGYRKDVDWIEYRIAVPEPGGTEAERLHKLSQYILKRKNLHVATLHHKSEYGPYVRQVFELINAAYAPLYGVVELSDAQIERYAKKFIPLVDPEFVCFVLDEQENLVAFGVTTARPLGRAQALRRPPVPVRLGGRSQ